VTYYESTNPGSLFCGSRIPVESENRLGERRMKP
jgi:hypothetical protein